MNKKICFVVGASEIVTEDFLYFYNACTGSDACTNEKSMDEKEILLIAADGGYSFLNSQKIEADMVVGDFDSLGYVPKHRQIIRHPAQKDDTDMLLAIKEGLKWGCNFFYLFGGLGNRPDHSIANIALLSFLKKEGARGILFGTQIHMTTIRNETLIFEAVTGGMVSVFALGDEAESVTINGLKYELLKEKMRRDFPIGISNEFVGKEGRIRVEEGELLVMWEALEEGFKRKLPRFL